MTALLVSVRDREEARLCLRAGVGLIDVKEPGRGSLGQAPSETLTGILDEVAGRCPVSAALGELAEWPDGAGAPSKYFFSNLPPRTSLKRLVDTAKSRWWVEHSDRELKEELGLDHFEGRSWRGWNHHAVLVLMAYAFLQDVRRRRVKKVPCG